MNALDVLCAQLTRDLFEIAKFFFTTVLIAEDANLQQILQRQWIMT